MYVLLTSENCTFKVGIQELNLQYIANSLLLTHHLTRGGGGKLKGGGFYTLFTDAGKVQIRHHSHFKIPVHFSKLKRQYFTDFNFIFSAFTKMNNTLLYHAKAPLIPSSVVTEVDDVD